MSYSFKKNGWTYVHIEGSPYKRGYDYGRFIVEDLKKMIHTVKYICMYDYGKSWNFFINASNQIFKPTIQRNYPELYEELKGIAAGCKSKGMNTSIDEIIAWNGSIPLFEYWWPNQEAGKVITWNTQGTIRKHIRAGGDHPNNNNSHSYHAGAPGRCSAFIAVGDYTKDGKIVLAHNTFDNFVGGQNNRYILSIKPNKGAHILMQTTPGYIWSGTDFFVTNNGFIGSETTIGGFLPYKIGNPIFCRIRKAMQYSKFLGDFEKYLLEGNTGGYANSWIFGDIRNNEIMRIELGLKYHTTERKKNGYFIGFNGSYDPRIRNLECRAQGFDDMRRHQGARHVRLTQLMRKYKGKIDVDIGKKILADHYDVYLKKINPCSRTVDSHYELDNRAFMSQSDRPKPFQPRGAVDGKVIDSSIAEKMQFWARWGNSSGMPFNVNKFCDKHIIWEYLRPYLDNRPSQPWILFSFNSKDKKHTKSNSKSRKIMKSKSKNKTVKKTLKKRK